MDRPTASARDLPAPFLRNRPRGAVLLVSFGLLLLVAAFHGPCLRNGFVNLDDRLYVTHNAHVLRGLTAENLRWAFGAGLGTSDADTDYWMPLSHLSHMADAQFFGLAPAAHHAVNLFLFALTVPLLFLVLRSWTGTLWRSALATGLWAVHPLRVESVAWIAERKDLLACLFFVLTLGCHLRAIRFPSLPNRALTALCFTLGLMCKPIVVPLPLLLLILDVWPLCRREGLPPLRRAVALIREKFPLFALSLLSCLLTLISQKQALDPEGQGTLMVRIGKAAVALCVYPVKMLFPADLAVYYPFPPHGWEPLRVISCLILLLLITGGVFLLRRKRPYLAAGWLWYLVMLAPASGIVLAGDQAYADRFTLLPQIGLCIAAVWLAADWTREAWNAAPFPKRRLPLLCGAFSALILLLLGLATARQTGFWHDDLGLWTHAVASTGKNAFARNELGNSLMQRGRTEDAVREYREAIRIEPRFATAQAHLGEALRRLGRLNEALPLLLEAEQRNPDLADTENSLADVLFQKGSPEQALPRYRRAVTLDPIFPEAHNMVGTIELLRGNELEALPEFRKALSLQPGNPQYANNVAWILATSTDPSLRDPKEAVTLAGKAVAATPDQPALLRTLAAAETAAGDREEGLRTAQKALELALSQGNKPLCDSLNNEISRYREGLHHAP